MAYDYQMGSYIPGNTEDEEERRRREEQERLEREAAYGAAQDAEDASMGAAMTANAAAPGSGSSFAGAADRYLQNRMGQVGQRFTDATQMFTDPEAALNQRMGFAQQPDAANTEVQSQTVKTYGDGSQEQIVKTQTPAPAPVAPEPQVQASAAAPAPAPSPAPAPV